MEYYECPLMDRGCPHFDYVLGVCRVERHIGKTPAEYHRCEAYEPDTTSAAVKLSPETIISAYEKAGLY